MSKGILVRIKELLCKLAGCNKAKRRVESAQETPVQRAPRVFEDCDLTAEKVLGHNVYRRGDNNISYVFIADTGLFVSREVFPR